MQLITASALLFRSSLELGLQFGGHLRRAGLRAVVAVLNDAKVAFLEGSGGWGRERREREWEGLGSSHWAWHEGQW